jgi:serine/threonine protein kinase
MDLLNQTVGKFKLTRIIGEGGMACVYEGVHKRLGTKVAVKVLNPFLARNEQLSQRFEKEANFMASMNHPNIVKVIDIEEINGTLAIVLELLEGEDLDQKVKRKGSLDDKEIELMFSQILNAFEYAHSQGIVHRDIKPANIFIDNSGQVKILDFGIAKNFGTGNEMTQTGTQMGTPIYMSPEQVKGDKSLDHRSDIYSLGVLLFYLTTGKVPFESSEGSSYEIFTKIVNDPIPLTGNIRFDEIIQKATQKDRNLRYEDLQTFKSKLLINNSLDLNTPIQKVVNETFTPSKKEEKVMEYHLESKKIENLEIYANDFAIMDWHQAMNFALQTGNSWRLPTLDELNLLYLHQDEIGGLNKNEYYWSSDCDDELNVWVKYFYTGYQCRINKRENARDPHVKTPII